VARYNGPPYSIYFAMVLTGKDGAVDLEKMATATSQGVTCFFVFVFQILPEKKCQNQDSYNCH
jgi:hypothetical protein